MQRDQMRARAVRQRWHRHPISPRFMLLMLRAPLLFGLTLLTNTVIAHATIAEAGGPAPMPVPPSRTQPTTVTTSLPPNPVPPPRPSGAALTLGVYVPNVPWDISQIDQFTAMVGATPGIIHYFLSWSDGGPFDPTLNNAIVARDATPMLSWNPHDWHYGVDQPNYTDAVIASGQYDALLKQWGHDLGVWGKPFYLRIGDEMNGDWDSWSPGVNGNSVDDYLAMWRHVVTTMRAAGSGLPNVRFVWCPNVVGDAQDFRPLYPGDAYVDWVGLDGYNWGDTRSDGWKTFSQIFASSYTMMLGLTSKPLMIAETGCVEQGGDKGIWFTQSFIDIIPQQFPRIQAVVYFDEDRSADGEGDWRVNTSTEALSHYAAVAQSVLWQGRVP